MSLEAALAENTKALTEHSELLKLVHAGQGAALAAAKAVTEKVATGTKAADKKPAEGAGEPAADKKPALTRENISELVVKYCGAEGDHPKPERDARRAKVTELFGKVSAKTVKDVPEDRFAAVAKALNTLIDQGNLLKVEEAAEGDDDDDNLLG